jgi:hypothetical protein
MGHRDVWGKDPKKWQKWCPCFDAEAEYAEIGKVVPVQNPTLLLEPIAQVDTSEVVPVEESKEVPTKPVSHETLIKRIVKFFAPWMKK